MEDCVFCSIIRHEVPGRIEYEDDDLVIFKDINPQAPVHLLIVPRKHIPSLPDASEEDQAILGRLMLAAGRVAREQGLDQDGFRLVMNTGRKTGQSVFHIHFHLLGGRAMHWPPG